VYDFDFRDVDPKDFVRYLGERGLETLAVRLHADPQF
jgi:hypothetical protein